MSCHALVVHPLSTSLASFGSRLGVGPGPATAGGFLARGAVIYSLGRGRPYLAIQQLALGHLLDAVSDELAVTRTTLGAAALGGVSDVLIIVGLAGMALLNGVWNSAAWWVIAMLCVGSVLYVTLGHFSLYSTFVRENELLLLALFIGVLSPVFLEAERTRERLQLHGMWSSAGLMDGQSRLPSFYRSDSGKLPNLRGGVVAGMAVLFPYVYCILIAMWRCDVQSPPPPQLCQDAKDAPLFANLFWIVEADDFIPRFFFLAAHATSLYAWWDAGVPRDAVVAAGVSFLFLEASTFAGSMSYACYGIGIGLYCLVLLQLAFTGPAGARTLMLRWTSVACAALCLLLIGSGVVLSGRDGDSAFWNYAHFSVAEYTLMMFSAYGAYQVVMERGRGDTAKARKGG